MKVLKDGALDLDVDVFDTVHQQSFSYELQVLDGGVHDLDESGLVDVDEEALLLALGIADFDFLHEEVALHVEVALEVICQELTLLDVELVVTLEESGVDSLVVDKFEAFDGQSFLKDKQVQSALCYKLVTREGCLEHLDLYCGVSEAKVLKPALLNDCLVQQERALAFCLLNDLQGKDEVAHS